VLLAGPIASAVTGLVVMIAGAGRSTAIQTAAALFAFFSFAMTAVTLIPVPTFGGRVWSDLATVLYLLRATDRALEEDRLLGAQERVVVLLESGMPERAIRTARTAVETAPRAPRAYGLLAYALHHAGHADEAGDVARGALDLAQDDATRAYLRQYVGIERS
jgi:tetratricopeptide (TPR) repeat protein